MAPLTTDPWAQPPPWAGETTGPQDPLWVQPPPAGEQSWPGDQPGDQTGPIFEQHPWASGSAPGQEPWSAATTVLPPDQHAGPAGPAGPGGARPASPRRRKARLPIVAGVVALALVAAILVFVNRHSGTPGGPAVAGSGAATNGGGQHSQGKVGGDWMTITVPGIFPHVQETVGGLRFTQVASGLEQDCALAANGAFASALASQGCKRVVRATFVDSGKQYAVTVGVAALPTGTAARAVNTARQFGSDIWFTGLDGPPGSGATGVAKSVGMGYEFVHERFLVFALATYCNGHSPAGKAAEIDALTTLDKSFTALALRPILAQQNG